MGKTYTRGTRSSEREKERTSLHRNCALASLVCSPKSTSHDSQCFDGNYFYVNYREKFIVKTRACARD